MLMLFSVVYLVLKIKYVLLTICFQSHSKELHYVTVYEKKNCVYFNDVMLFQINTLFQWCYTISVNAYHWDSYYRFDSDSGNFNDTDSKMTSVTVG